MGKLYSSPIYAGFLAVALSGSVLSAQVVWPHPELPPPTVDRGQGCVWAAPQPILSGKKAVTQPAELVDAPSHVWQISALGTPTAGQSQAIYSAQPNAPPQQYVAPTRDPVKKAYQPLTPVQKLDIFYSSTYSPDTFLSAAFDAGLAHAQGDFRGYGGGMAGYGKRFGGTLADQEAGIFFGKFLFPWVLKQDPRYFPMEEGPLGKRAFYALTRVLVARTDSGGNTFNSSRILAALVGKTLSNAYYPPERRGLWPTMRRTGNALISDAVTALAREFWPDVRNKFLGKRFPKKVNDLADWVVIGK